MIPHLLSWIIFTPLIGCVLVLICAKRAAKWIGVTATAATGALSLAALCAFDPGTARPQLVENLAWIPQFDIYYFIGVDGISLPMVLLTALISLAGCIASFGIKEREREYYLLYLLLETGMMGTFMALDLFLFYIFWEAVLVPAYFLIGIWGGLRREYAAIKFFLYTLAGSLFILLGIIALYLHSDPHTFNWYELSRYSFGIEFQKIIFLAFFLGFAIKVPVFPFHTWLPDAHINAPAPVSAILAGVLLKMGAYGFLRFNYPLFPEAALWFKPAMLIFAVAGIIYGGFLTLAQTDLKKMIAYSSISQMGFVLLGLGTFTINGFNGALLQMLSHGIIISGLFLLAGVLYDRTHTRDMNSFGGLNMQMPAYSAILIFFSLASLGFPGLSGFIAEFLILIGTFSVSPLSAILTCTGIILSSAYLLLMIRKVLLGPENAKWKGLPDINGREAVPLIPLMILILMIGVYPNFILPVMTPAMNALLTSLGIKF